MAVDPLSECFPVTIFTNLAGKRLRTEKMCLRDLLALFEDTDAPEKDRLPLIKLATFGKKTSDKGSLRTDENLIEINGLEGDYDAEKMDPEDAAELLEKAGVAAIVCTTTSHRPNAPRWRVFCPLSREYKPAERYELLARLNGVLGGVLGAESFKPSQCYYFGNITDARPLKFFEVDGDYIDLIDHLKDGALGANGVHPDDEGEEDDEEHDSTDLDEAQELYERDLDSGKLEEALEFAISVQHEQGKDADKEEDRNHWWRNVCWAIHHGSGGSKDGFKLWRDYARRTYRAERLKARGESVDEEIRREWRYAKNHRNGGVLGFGSVYKNLRDLGWGDPVAEVMAALEEDDKISAGEKKRRERVAATSANEPDMSVLKEASEAAPKFPLYIFGSAAGKIRAAARGVSAPEDFVAAAILGGTSACIGNSTRVQVRENFIQAPILWCQVVGQPSTNKSPALKLITSALRAIEQDYEIEYLHQVREWKSKAAVAEQNLRGWNARVADAVAKGEEPPEQPEDSIIPPEPDERALVLNDLTIEAFMRSQARNPRGFMVFRDELAGWLANMERYSSNTERGTWLESYDGGFYAIKRVKDGNLTIRVEHLCAPILGGIQPERLLSIAAETTVDDGLQARLMPFWPDAEFVPMAERVERVDWLEGVFRTLRDIEMNIDSYGRPTPNIVPFSAKAFDLFRRWSDNRKLTERHTHHRLQGVYGKAEGQVARIALVLEYFWWSLGVTGYDEEELPEQVSAKAVESAIEFREKYLKPMQTRVFLRAIEPLEVTNARTIADWIIAHNVDVLDVREVRRTAGLKGLSDRKTEEFDAAIAQLVAKKWLVPVEKESSPRGGRPKKNFRVNERVWELLED